MQGWCELVVKKKERRGIALVICVMCSFICIIHSFILCRRCPPPSREDQLRVSVGDSRGLHVDQPVACWRQLLMPTSIHQHGASNLSIKQRVEHDLRELGGARVRHHTKRPGTPQKKLVMRPARTSNRRRFDGMVVWCRSLSP
jgi:hypothetical protein